jgi:transcriptional regulator with XRE-family HTH domain
MRSESLSNHQEEPTHDVLRVRKVVGQAIARYRQNADMTQEDLAERLGIGSEAVSRLERGVGAVTAERLVVLAEIFDCRSDELLLGASERLSDQTVAFGHILHGLSPQDTRFVIESAERLASHLRLKAEGEPRHRD